jgi:hypothetical protein
MRGEGLTDKTANTQTDSPERAMQRREQEEPRKSFVREFVVADDSALKAKWSCIGRKAFFCAFCQHDFQLGDEYRMVYTNDMSGAGGNPLTCKPCFDANGGLEGLRQKWIAINEEFKTRFKWFYIR